MKNRKQLIEQIRKKIEEYKKIIIVRHIRPDGDCVGASLGLREMLRDNYPEKEILCIAKDYATNLNFLRKEDEEREENYYKDALCIAVDTATKERLSNTYFSSCKEIIKIDHHPNVDPYGVINWVEDEISATCELITIFGKENNYKISNATANLLYMGITTDTGRFKYSSVNGDTLRNASILLDANIDLEVLYSNLYLKDFESFKLQSEVYKKMKQTKNKVTYIYVTKEMQEKYGLSANEASMVVGSLDSIKESLIWIAFIDSPDGSIRVRLRSRFVEINKIAEKYNGGGHTKASGATVYSQKEMKKLIKDCDKLLEQYKKENTGWL